MSEVKAKVTADASGFTSGMRSALLQVEALKVGVKAAASVISGFGRFLAESAEAAGVQKKALDSLGAAFSRVGVENVQAATDQFAQFASELQKVTSFGDEAIIQAASIGASFGLTGEELEKTARAATDFSAVLGTDLQSAMQLLARAADGNTTLLTRYGIEVDKNIPKSQRFAAALEQINSKFGGAAQAAVNNYNGRLTQAKNAFGDLKEAIGAIVTPALEVWLQTATDLFGSTADAIKGSTQNLQIFIRDAAADAVGVFASLIESVAVFVDLLYRFRDALGILTEGGFKAWLDSLPLPLKLAAEGMTKLVEATGHVTKSTGEASKSVAPLVERLRQLAEKAKAQQISGDNVFAKIKKGSENAKPPVKALAEAVDDLADAVDRVKLEPMFARFAQSWASELGPMASEFAEELTAGLNPLADIAEKSANAARDAIESNLPYFGDLQFGADEASDSIDNLNTGLGKTASTYLEIADNSIITAESVANMLASAIAGANSLEEALGNVLNKIIQIGLEAAGSSIGGAIAGAPGAAIGQAFGSLLGKIFSVFHDGGTFKSARAPRLPGMSSDEGLAILKDGETVLTPEQMMTYGGGGGNTINITISSSIPPNRTELDRFMRDVVTNSLSRVAATGASTGLFGIPRLSDAAGRFS